MTKKERNEIVKFAEKLTDEELEKEYYDAVYSSLGSQCEDMYKLGYDIADIVKREKYEKYLSQRADLLGALCEQRGIKLWEKECRRMTVKYDRATKAWFNSHIGQQTTVCKCEKCGLFFKPSLGHKCKVKESNGE